MKRFKIVEDGVVKYQIEGESISEIYKGREIPKLWKDNLKSVVEEDITEEIKAQEELEEQSKELSIELQKPSKRKKKLKVEKVLLQINEQKLFDDYRQDEDELSEEVVIENARQSAVLAFDMYKDSKLSYPNVRQYAREAVDKESFKTKEEIFKYILSKNK